MMGEKEIMKKPEMILFDYGQTLVNEARFDGVKGTEAVMKFASANRRGLSAEEIQREADAINRELGRFDPARRHLFQAEVPNHMFTKYLYESLEIEISLSDMEIDRVFWNAAAPGVPTEGMEEFLSFLKNHDIRTGVISNISYCGKAVEERIHSVLPRNEFEFILATSEYLFRKPNKRIFELALKKAGLEPEDVWYIGDNYECDVEGARNAGIFPVWYIGAIDDCPPVKREAAEECLSREGKADVLTVKSWKELRDRMRL